MELAVNELNLPRQDLQKLLTYGSGDAALLLLYLRCGNPIGEAGRALHLTEPRLLEAKAALQQLGLWQEEPVRTPREELRPQYTEQDVLAARERDTSFVTLLGEVQRNLGRVLSMEELKILLGILRYLELPVEVVSLLISYCKEKNRRRGNPRNPSMRAIERTAYAWADQGIDTMETAVAFIREERIWAQGLEKIKKTLQIRDRNLTPGEEKYAKSWLEMGFDQEALALAYEKTCMNTGGLKWPYMNKILQSWHSQGLHTGSQVRSGDKKPEKTEKNGPRELDAEEREAIAWLLQEAQRE